MDFSDSWKTAGCFGNCCASQGEIRAITLMPELVGMLESIRDTYEREGIANSGIVTLLEKVESNLSSTD